MAILCKPSEVYFNSSVVRLRAQFLIVKLGFALISIPVWCD